MKKIRWLKILTILSIAVFLNGCAIGRTSDYSTGSVDYNTGINEQVHFVVAFQDVRPYVLSGNKKNTFVGLQRSVAGVPWPVNTKSGKPLADDFGTVVTRSLRDKGLNAEYIKFDFRKDVDAFVKENSKTGRKILVFSIYEWKTDVYFTSSIHYNVLLTVYDSNGIKLVDARRQGSDALGPNERAGRKNLTVANIDIIGGLLKTPEIQAALLRGDVAAPVEKKVTAIPEKEEKCSVQQVLKMKDAGLSDNQIQAACE